MDNRKSKNESFIDDAKERLQWYATEASEEEFNVEEVDALVNLLEILEPRKVRTEHEQEADLERFRAYCKKRMEEGGLMDEETIEKVTLKLNSTNTLEGLPVSEDTMAMKQNKQQEMSGSKFESKTKKSFSTFMRSHKLVTTATAVLIMLLVVAGSFGAVNAENNGGFFYWLSRDDEGVTMITSPEDMGSEMGAVGDSYYNSVNDVPEQYLRYVVEKEEFSSLEGYDLQSIRIAQSDLFCLIQQIFVSEVEKKEVVLGVKIYVNEELLMREDYTVEELREKSVIIEEGLLLVEEPAENEKFETSILFYDDNKQYFAKGNCEVEVITEVANEYRDFVMLFSERK